MLDVIMEGDVAIIAAADFRYNQSDVRCNGVRDRFLNGTSATAGNPGTYTLKGTNYVATVTDEGDEYGLQLTNVETDLVQAMALKEDSTITAFDGSTAGTVGNLDWAAASGGVNTITYRVPKV
jgi:hypothetical protein